MVLASLLLVTSIAAAPQPASTAPQAPVPAGQDATPQTSQTPQTPERTATVKRPSKSASAASSGATSAAAATPAAQSDPEQGVQPQTAPHAVGVGVNMGTTAGNGMGSFRFWPSRLVGIEVAGGWSPSFQATPALVGAAPVHVASGAYAATSVVLMLKAPNPANAIDFRPYVGGGMNYVRYNNVTPAGSLLSLSGAGGQGFGGVEVGFQSANHLTIDTEMRYTDFHSPAAGFATGRWDMLVGLNLYFK